MSDPIELLDPQIEEILRDIAKDPGSTLLRVERSREVRDLSVREQPLSARAAGWSSAERKLLECYRDEVAYLLRCQYFVRFVEHERFEALRESWDSRTFFGASKSTPREEGEIRALLQAEHAAVRAMFPTDPVSELVHKCLGVSLFPGSTSMELAAASLRLAPTESGRMYVGYEYRYSGYLRSALRVFQQVAQECRDSATVSSALSFVGDAYLASSQFAMAAEAYSTALKLDSTSIESLFSGLGARVQLGDLDAVVESVDLIDATFAADSAEVLGWRRFIDEGRRKGDWVPTEDSRRVIQGVSNRIGSTSGVILDAYL